MSTRSTARTAAPRRSKAISTICCSPTSKVTRNRAMLSANIILAADVETNKPYDNVKPVEQKLSAFETLWGIGAFRKTLLILSLAIIWQVYASYLDNPLLFPTLSDTIITLVDRFADGTLPARIWTTLQILFAGYALGTVLAAILTVLAINTRIGTDFLETMT